MSKRVLCLFDVDGTLTEPRKVRRPPPPLCLDAPNCRDCNCSP